MALTGASTVSFLQLPHIVNTNYLHEGKLQLKDKIEFFSLGSHRTNRIRISLGTGYEVSNRTIINQGTKKCPPLTRTRTCNEAKCDWVCSTCEVILELSADFLPKNFTEARLDEILDKFCNKTGKFDKDCELIVTLFGGDIFKAITGEIPPGLIGAHVIFMWTSKFRHLLLLLSLPLSSPTTTITFFSSFFF